MNAATWIETHQVTRMAQPHIPGCTVPTCTVHTFNTPTGRVEVTVDRFGESVQARGVAEEHVEICLEHLVSIKAM